MNHRSAGPINNRYKVKAELRPKGLAGLSEEQLAQHWALYEGYVKNVNLLNEEIAELVGKRDFGPKFAELKRRVGYEYDGMILHEKYFSVLKPGDHRRPGDDTELVKLMKKSFGGFEAWKEEFQAIGKMRGVGWAILYYDPSQKRLSNHWIGLHEQGHPAGFAPLLVMDVWEHAYMVDYAADGRPLYAAAFFKNLDWRAVEKALAEASRSEPAPQHAERR